MISTGPVTGSLTVTIAPAGALAAGAQWRVGGGDWNDSGDTVSGLLVGEHTVSFSDLAGWTSPADKVVTIEADETASTTGTYVQHTGSLFVMIEPADARDEGAQWRLDGGDWQNGYVILTDLSVGEHLVEFKDIESIPSGCFGLRDKVWTTPDDQTVEILADETILVTGTYVLAEKSLNTSARGDTLLLGSVAAVLFAVRRRKPSRQTRP